MALGLEGVDGFRRTRISAATCGLGITKLVKRAKMESRASHDAASRTLHLLEMDLATHFSRFAGIAARIDAQLEVMREFIQRLPAGSARQRERASA